MQVRCHHRISVHAISWDISNHPFPAAWLKTGPEGLIPAVPSQEENMSRWPLFAAWELWDWLPLLHDQGDTRDHSQVISRTLYPGRTVVLQRGRVRRQGVWRSHLPGWLLPPLRWANRSLARTLTWASCSTWPTTSRWTVVNGSDPLQWGQSNVSARAKMGPAVPRFHLSGNLRAVRRGMRENFDLNVNYNNIAMRSWIEVNKQGLNWRAGWNCFKMLSVIVIRWFTM